MPYLLPQQINLTSFMVRKKIIAIARNKFNEKIIVIPIVMFNVTAQVTKITLPEFPSVT